MHIKIYRKEAKESRYWLKLVHTNNNPDQEATRNLLINEFTELMNNFGAILQKCK